MKLKVADFSDTPSGRYITDGPHSGEEFREKYLLPNYKALKNNEKLIIIIDGVEGYGSSFLEEAFGGLVRIHKIPANELLSRMEIVFDDDYFELYQNRIIAYIKEAG